jgi:hypothetical protein
MNLISEKNRGKTSDEKPEMQIIELNSTPQLLAQSDNYGRIYDGKGQSQIFGAYIVYVSLFYLPNILFATLYTLVPIP